MGKTFVSQPCKTRKRVLRSSYAYQGSQNFKERMLERIKAIKAMSKRLAKNTDELEKSSSKDNAILEGTDNG